MYSYKWYTYLFICIVLIFEPYIFKWLSIGPAYPNLLLVLLMLAAMGKKDNQTIIIFSASGFIYDLLYSSFIGPVTLFCFLASFGAITLAKHFERENMIILTISAWGLSFLRSLYALLLNVGFKEFYSRFFLYGKEALFSATYTASLVFVLTVIFFIINNTYAKRSKRLLYGQHKQNN